MPKTTKRSNIKKQEMFLNIYIPNILIKYIDSYANFKGVESNKVLREDINGTEYRFVGYFDTKKLVNKIKKDYEKEYLEHYDTFTKTLKEEITKLKDEGAME